MSLLTESALAERESRMMELCYGMLNEIAEDLNDTKSSVVQTRKRNSELEKLASQATYENSRLKERLNQALKRLDESAGLLQRSEHRLHSEVEEARQAAAGEMERALNGLKHSTDVNMQLEERAFRAEKRCQELQQAATENQHSTQRLQQALTEANQVVTSLTRRLDESVQYTRTLEAALEEMRLSQVEAVYIP